MFRGRCIRKRGRFNVARLTQNYADAITVRIFHSVSPDRLPSFPVFLRELRRAAGLTQEELAQGARVGVRTLRDLETGRAVRPQRSTVDLLASALGLEGAERDRFVAAARGRPRADGRAVRGQVSLGVPPELIGRESAVQAVADLLDVARLVTLVGLAGIGKSVLAIAIGHHVADRCPGGVGGVVVADASTPAEVLGSVAATFKVSRVDGLAERLAGGSALLVLDAVDRNRPAALSALATLRRLMPELRVLATSRHPLKLADEYEWPVPPLEVPPPTVVGEEVFAYPATALFLDRLRRVRDRPVEPAEAETLGALVRRLGGVPLALELAAARGRILDLPEMLRRCRGVRHRRAGRPDAARRRAGQRGPARPGRARVPVPPGRVPVALVGGAGRGAARR